MTKIVVIVVVVSGLFASAAAAIAPPNDPLYAQQTAPGGALAIIHEPQALATIGATPLADVIVANLDTGLDLDHPDFASRLVTVAAGTPAPNSYGSPPPAPTQVPDGGSNGWDLLGTLTDVGGVVHPDADPTDPIGQTSHGTLVAGILGAAFNNGQGGVGVAPNARFLAIRSCWDDDDCFQSIQPDAVDWAAARGVRVISMSWLATLGDYTTSFAPALHAASNTLFVAIPSGNGGATPADDGRRPCGDPVSNVLCVSTSSPSDGLDCGDYSPTIVDLAVPTQNNVTTTNGGGFTNTGCATSFAAPTAAGAATVLFGLDPTATPEIVKQALIDSARPAGDWAGKSVSGGILDLDAAVKLFAQRRGIALTPDAPGAPGVPGTLVPPGATAPDRSAPRLSLRLSRTSFAPDDGARKPHGVTLTVTLSEPATVKLSIARRITGRRVGGHCVAATPGNRRRPACTRSAAAVTLRLGSLVAGSTRVHFSARLEGRALAVGAYEASAVATDPAGNRSSTRVLRFAIVR